MNAGTHAAPGRTMTAIERMRLDDGAAHLHALGARATAELLAALVARVGGGAALAELLNDYRRLTPAAVQQAGGSHFPQRKPRHVPADLMRGAA